MRIWGYWATFGWALLAFIVGQFGALGLVLWLRADDLGALLANPYDGVTVTLFLLIANPIMVGVIALAVGCARAGFADYLALVWPSRRELVVGLVSLVGVIALGDALLLLSGRDLVAPFQTQSYATAAAEGWLVPMAAAAIVLAPAGEEILFRGFLFRGWARSPRSIWPAIVVISIAWAALHIQYDWVGILQIFIVGLFLGWIRWRSSSTLLTFLLHALFNLEATVETVLRVKFFS
jgi:membrane protease YdiL (CAAX protease family)